MTNSDDRVSPFGIRWLSGCNETTGHSADKTHRTNTWSGSPAHPCQGVAVLRQEKCGPERLHAGNAVPPLQAVSTARYQLAPLARYGQISSGGWPSSLIAASIPSSVAPSSGLRAVALHRMKVSKLARQRLPIRPHRSVSVTGGESHAGGPHALVAHWSKHGAQITVNRHPHQAASSRLGAVPHAIIPRLPGR